MSRRPGKGSRVPHNVKLRPIPADDEIAKPRRGGSSETSWAVIPRNEVPDWKDEDEEKDDRDDAFNHGLEEMRPLEDMDVCTTGELQMSREDIRRTCTALGAKFESVLKLDTTFLIADKTEGDKYRAAVENGIPVLHSRFLQVVHSLWIQGSSEINVTEIANRHRVDPLHGLTICLTGYDDTIARTELRDRISLMGGAAYSPQFHSGVTHLVIGPKFNSMNLDLEDQAKVKGARTINRRRVRAGTSSSASTSNAPQEKIHIVWGEWIEHSLLAYGRLNEDLYSAEIQKERPVHWRQSWQRATDDITDRRHPKKANSLPKVDKEDMQGPLLTTTILANQTKTQRKRLRSTQAGSDSELENASSQSGRPKKSSKHDLNPSKSIPKAATMPNMELEHARVRKSLPSSLSISRPTLKKSRSATSSELMGVNSLLHPPSTYSDKLTAIKKEIDSQSELKPPTSQGGPQTSSILTKISKDRVIKVSAPISSLDSKTALKDSRMEPSLIIQPDQAAKIALEVSTVEAEKDSDGPPALIFEGKTFSLSFPGVASALLQVIRNCITERGGSIDESNSDTVDYIVTKTIQLGNPSCNLEDPRVRSDIWLEQCSAYDQLLALEDDATSFCTPILYGGAVTNSEDYYVSYAGFDSVGVEIVEKVCKSLGLKHDRSLIRNKTTHLIVAPGYLSKRLEAARRWGIQVVQPLWLRELMTGITATGEDLSESLDGQLNEVQNEQDKDEINCDVSRIETSVVEDSGPLSGCYICVYQKLMDRSRLSRIAESLGATLTYSPASGTPSTHFIYQSKIRKDTNKDFRLAQDAGCFIVHPAWLEACQRDRSRLSEAVYAHTYNASRSLNLLVTHKSDTSIDSQSRLSNRRSDSVAGTSVHGQATNMSGHSSAPASPKDPIKPSTSYNSFLQSTPHKILPADFNLSPPLPTNRSSDATVYSSPPAPQNEVLSGDDPRAHSKFPDDSGFAPSSAERTTTVNITDMFDASSSSSPVVPSHSKTVSTTNLPLTSTSEADLDSTPKSTAAGEQPTNSAMSRDLLAQMQAMMDAGLPEQINARLPYQQPAFSRSRRTGRKSLQHNSLGTGSSPDVKKSVGFLEAGLRARQMAGYDTLYDSQLGGPPIHGDSSSSNDTQSLQTGYDESSMVIRVQDAHAEATKAKLLAGVRREHSGASLSKEPQGQDGKTDRVDAPLTRRTRVTRKA